MSRELRIEAVSHAYALREVLHDIALTLPAGRTLALVGPSGCGKTTLLHLCAGLLTVQTGVLKNGFLRPAVMFQEPRLLPWQSTRDNIALGLKALAVPTAELRRRADAIGHAVGLDALALSQFPNALSGGMQSRAALARALALAPDLLLMDEPFSALDIGLKAQLHRLLLDHQSAHGLAVLMITHDLMEALRLADSVVVMAADPGRIVFRAELATPARERSEADVFRSTAALLRQPAVCAAFDLAVPPATAAREAGEGDGALPLFTSVLADAVDGNAGVPPKKGLSC